MVVAVGGRGGAGAGEAAREEGAREAAQGGGAGADDGEVGLDAREAEGHGEVPHVGDVGVEEEVHDDEADDADDGDAGRGHW